MTLFIYFCNFGIDILSSNIFDVLERNIYENKKNKEIQLRDAMKELWKKEGCSFLIVYLFNFLTGMEAFFHPETKRFDFGVPKGYRDTLASFSIFKQRYIPWLSTTTKRL
jgi:UTP-glucose-1-phosphate uridylyltransferase